MTPAYSPTRRGLLRSAVAGSLLMRGIVSELLAAESAATDPLAARPSPNPSRAKNVIFLFMSGGVSHVDSFDPKPKLHADHGKQIVLDHPETKNRPGYEKLFLKKPQWAFKPRGRCGTEISELFPHVANRADDLCVVRSMHGDHSNHYNATLGIHTGSFTFARPSLGAWVSYGLGTVNKNLPSFVVIAPHTPYAGGQVWASDFLPGSHQGTLVVPGPEPLKNIKPRTPKLSMQERELAALAELNRLHLRERGNDPQLAARLKSFETAFGMQMEAPQVFDLAKETDETLKLYGLPRGSTAGFAWQCLIARRLIERGVRFVELIDTGSSGNWDSHGDMMEHGRLAKNVDQPMAALITDLKRRGMLDDTLVVWTSEFGRTPFNNTPDAKGREHHNWAFSSWMAGGGVKGGIAYGKTDEHGIKVADNGVHVHDFHATILHLLGIDHTKLTFRHASRDFRLTDVHGSIIEEILANIPPAVSQDLPHVDLAFNSLFLHSPQFLVAGALGVAGLSIADVLRAEATGEKKGRPKSVIYVVLGGGPSHIDMYDLKPDAPDEYRGPFKPIATSLTGVRVCELMPLQARMMDRLTLLRGFRSVENDHFLSEVYSGLPRGAGKRPAFGSVVSKLLQHASPLPPYVSLSRATTDEFEFEKPYYAGSTHAPFRPFGEALDDLKPAKSLGQLQDRRELLKSFDAMRRDLDRRDSAGGLDRFHSQALRILTSPAVRDAFDLSKEPERVRDGYGKGKFPHQTYKTIFYPWPGEQLLLARRLVEAGVRVVTLRMGDWDHHSSENGDIFLALRCLLPLVDRSVTALVDDLSARGLGEDVLVVVLGEFGRTPKIGQPGPGREHHADAGCVLLYGGGLKMGQVIGETDARAERAKTGNLNFQNLLATIYHVLGIDPSTTLAHFTGKPQYLLDETEPIKELVG